MNTAQRVQVAFVGALRPFSDVRGAGRVCRLINRCFLKTGVPPIQVGQMRDGTRMRLDLRSQTEWYSFYSGRYDDASIALIRKLLVRLDGGFLDVGGNIGMYSIRVAAGLGAGRRCLCFEPMPDNAARIRENACMNDLEDRVEVQQIALSDANGEAMLVLREDFELGSATGNASIEISEDADGRFRKISVPMRRFDDALAEMGTAKFLIAKVDIGGHEDFFLRGAQEWLHRDRPIILTEINNWFYEKRGTTSSAVFTPTLPDGYNTALLREDGATSWLEACALQALAGRDLPDVSGGA